MTANGQLLAEAADLAAQKMNRKQHYTTFSKAHSCIAAAFLASNC